jgi:hypothetical protein
MRSILLPAACCLRPSNHSAPAVKAFNPAHRHEREIGGHLGLHLVLQTRPHQRQFSGAHVAAGVHERAGAHAHRRARAEAARRARGDERVARAHAVRRGGEGSLLDAGDDVLGEGRHGLGHRRGLQGRGG